MDGKPFHYDGSVQNLENNTTNTVEEPFTLTDEMKRNISGNPYDFNKE